MKTNKNIIKRCFLIPKSFYEYAIPVEVMTAIRISVKSLKPNSLFMIGLRFYYMRCYGDLPGAIYAGKAEVNRSSTAYHICRIAGTAGFPRYPDTRCPSESCLLAHSRASSKRYAVMSVSENSSRSPRKGDKAEMRAD